MEGKVGKDPRLVREALVVDDMPVEDVELVPRHRVQYLTRVLNKYIK